MRPFIDRFFFALLPPPDLAGDIVAFGRGLGLRRSAVQAERLHLTLAITDDFPFGADGDVTQRLLEAGARVAVAPFVVRLDRIVQGPRSVMLLPGKGRRDGKGVFAALAPAMAGLNVPLRAGWGYSPHMTLSYDLDHRFGSKPAGGPAPAFEWIATELALVRSLVGLHRHQVLARWPLVAAPAAQMCLPL
ncbi:2'-5' RNA ligase family protein [Novosphingobium sp. EMRT-2]|uniref:2'-5' RNA ligase family protein n=1 Tax=Novosphingobium sp. EMRT-2 TaxID=2571749 RepID=UPI0010BD0BEF|nr:2'-5' RNA ligase family protein [Novosphingobium sp. EMRT-2]QCI95032.1 hypothetical protein FA702_16910 [Novosphingobium sp. EMRT-2]